MNMKLKLLIKGRRVKKIIFLALKLSDVALIQLISVNNWWYFNIYKQDEWIHNRSNTYKDLTTIEASP